MNPEVWHRHALANTLQSIALLAAMGGFLALLGWMLWGANGVVWLLLAGALLLLFNPVASPGLIMRMYRAERVTPDRAPLLTGALTDLARRAGLPTVPALYYIPSSMTNAFSTGFSDHAAIAVSDGLLHRLNTRETVAVLAHEVSHVRNNDIWVMGMADMFNRLTSMLSLFGQFLLFLNLPLMLLSGVSIHWGAVLILILAPTLSALAQLGLSRTRELNADLNAVRLTGDPKSLARALVKIEQTQGPFWERILLPGRRIPEPSMLRTHPPTEERVRRLLELELPTRPVAITLPLQRGIGAEPRVGDPITRRPSWHITGLWH
jgi:heat shock protein HtpX